MGLLLVIDDDDQIRRLAKEILVNAGYAVTEARDGQEGLSVCQERSIDLVIMDIFMPNKEGLESIKELRQEFPDIKVLAMSGSVPRFALDVLAVAKKFGAHQILRKPFDVETLLETVKATLSVT
jgi:CheY-like chemotaxis protein